MHGYEGEAALDAAIAELTKVRDHYRQNRYHQFTSPDVTHTSQGRVVVTEDGGVAYVPDQSLTKSTKSLNEGLRRFAMTGGAPGTSCPTCGGTGVV